MIQKIKAYWLNWKIGFRNALTEAKFGFMNAWETSGKIMEQNGVKPKEGWFKK